jgi:haloalkane dehalogenase
MSSLERAGGLAYRSAGDSSERVALLVHGYPESSYMWHETLPALAAAGWRAIAPDLAGYGDSEPDPPGTWERHVDALGRFVEDLQLGPVALVTHDWGVMIGLRWACDHPGAASSLVISDGGFFSDRRWHDVANVMRTPGEGERLIAAYTREGLGAALGSLSSGISEAALDQYWKAFADEPRRLAQLELYRSGGLRQADPLRGTRGRARPPRARAVGGGGPVRRREDGGALPPGADRLGAARARGRRAFRVGRSAAAR